MPQNADGMRMEPAPSEPWWSGPSHAAAAAPAPALEPRLRQLDRGELLRPDQPGQLSGRCEGQPAGGAHELTNPLPSSARRVSSGAGVQNASPVAFWNSSILSRTFGSPIWLAQNIGPPR